MFSTGTYGSGGDADERLWAVTELWETTGDEALLAEVEERLSMLLGPMGINNAIRTDFDWPDMTNLAVATYLLSERPERDVELVATYTQFVIDRADVMASFAQGHPYGRAFTAYYWGTNGVLARASIVLNVAFVFTGDEGYREVIQGQLDYLLGRNPYRRSFVTGVGVNPPRFPHHRPSAADAVTDAWPGLLVGGSQPDSPLLWVDEQNNFTTNEVAINWGAAMAYLSAAMLAEPELRIPAAGAE
jgi:endoglucanase